MLGFILGGMTVVTALAYAAYKHYGLKTLELKVKTDVQQAVANAQKGIAASISGSGIIAGLKNDLSKYLGL